MMALPDFSTLPLDLAPTGPGPQRAPWMTPEGVLVPPAQDVSALEGLDFIHGLPGIAPYHRGP